MVGILGNKAVNKITFHANGWLNILSFKLNGQWIPRIEFAAALAKKDSFYPFIVLGRTHFGRAFIFKPDDSIGCKGCIAFNVFIDKNAVVVGEVVDCQLFGRKIEVRVSKARR